jgi:hypothetical protein
MSSIASLASSSPQAALGSATAAETATAGLGLPPVGLAQEASTNTVNAELLTSGFGVDPGSVAGVYGGAAQQGSNWFANVELLPALADLSRATAEQALALFGIQTPTVGAGSSASVPIPGSSTVGAAIVDPLFGKNA